MRIKYTTRVYYLCCRRKKKNTNRSGRSVRAYYIVLSRIKPCKKKTIKYYKGE